MARPAFALTAYASRETRNFSRYTEVMSRRYFASEAGALAAYRLGECERHDDAEFWHDIEKLQPGLVYDFDIDKWVDGEAYQRWIVAPRKEAVWSEGEDYIPF